MKRIFCLLLVLMMVLSLSVQAFADEDVLYCRICGKQIPTDSKVCPYCGKEVVLVASASDDAKDSGAKSTDTAEPASSDAPAAPATETATDVKTGLSQSTAPSPATQAAQTADPGPFNSTPVTNSSGARVYITKSPTSESVPYGGSCMFIAHAANATSVTWYIANSDKSLITTVAEAPGRTPGLSVSGANSDTLVLSGIPSWMNGCQVQACFTGEGGPVYSEPAYIWTYEEYVSAPRPWYWWDWYNFYFSEYYEPIVDIDDSMESVEDYESGSYEPHHPEEFDPSYSADEEQQGGSTGYVDSDSTMHSIEDYKTGSYEPHHPEEFSVS